MPEIGNYKILMMKNHLRILIFGFGNPGRKDDGMGPAIADMIEEWVLQNNLKGIDTDSNYQLNIEDADTIQDYDIVVFADASSEDIDHFLIDRVIPSGKVAFNTHSVSPGFVLDLCHRLFDKDPEVYLLHIKAFEFTMEEGFSTAARENLDLAFNFLTKALAEPEIFHKLNMETQMR